MAMKRIMLSVCAAVAAAVLARAETTYTWVGGNGNWEDGTKWNSSQGEGVPGAGDHAVLPAPSAAAGNYVVTANEAINVKSLTVGGGSGGGTATFESKTVEMHHVANDLVVNANGVMTHTAGDDKTPYKLNLTVGGNVTIAANGAIEANAKGKSTKGYSSNSSGGWGCNGNYGGRGNTGAYGGTSRCYGSIREPNDLGSKGNASSGGGAIRLDVSGTLRVDGSLSADSLSGSSVGYGSGSGGSIWVTAKNLSGSGCISVVSYGQGGGTGYIGGGGRIAVKLTEATDFSATSAVTFNYATGTFYRENANDAPGRGELVMNGAGTRDFAATVTDAEEPFGKITLIGTSGTRKISILDGVVVSTGGDFGETGWTVEAAAGTTGGLNFLGAASGVTKIAGTLTLGSLCCTNGSDTLEFAKGMTVSVADNGRLWLKGTADHPLTVMSAEPSWNLTLGTHIDSLVAYVAASNSIASATVIDLGGVDLGGNVNWDFQDAPEIGGAITWLGTTDASWVTAANWVDAKGKHRLPVEADKVVFNAGAPVYPTLSVAAAAFYGIEIASGVRLTVLDTVLTVSHDIACAGELVLSGTTALSTGGDFTCAGKITLQDTTALSVGGNVTLAANALTASSKCSFTLVGAVEQTADLGGNLFNLLTVDCPSVTFTNGFTAAFFRCEQPRAAALRFSAGDTYDMADIRMLPGAGGSLTLDSTEGGRQWKLRAGAHAVCVGASVMDCDAGGGCAIVVTAYDNRGNNVNWRIAAFNEWMGANGTAWDDEGNWSGGVPSETSDVRIPSADNGPTLSAATTVRSLTVGDGTGTVTMNLSAPLTITDTLIVNGGATVVADHPVVVANDAYVAAGGVMTHTLGTDGSPHKLHLTVGGNLTVAEGGAIDANCKGNSGKGAATGNWGVCGTYGGIGSGSSKHCYGSIREPDDLGSRGWSTSGAYGGGAIRLNVSGTLRVDGSVSADSDDYSAGGPPKGGGSGSGGSVWVTAGTLTGNGVISVFSYGYSTTRLGCGRIAVRQTDATDFAASAVSFNYGDGTLYRESASDAPGRGELTMNGAGTREFSNAVVDSTEPFGKITLIGTSGTRKISILDGVVVSTAGDFGAAGWTVEAASGTTGGLNVLGASSGVAKIDGTLALGMLCSTNDAGTLEFAKGMTVSVADNGRLWLKGTEDRPLTVMSAEPSWNLTLGANVDSSVRYVAASNSVASAMVVDIGGTDLGGNVNWDFQDAPEIGGAITWLGTTDANWGTVENWVDAKGKHRLPGETDRVVFNAGAPVYPTLSVAAATFYGIEIASGAQLTILDMPVTVSHDVIGAGKLVLAGTTALSVGGNVTLAAKALTASAKSSFTFAGEASQTADLGGNRFNLLTVDCPFVTFTNGFAAAYFRCEQPRAATLRFSAGDTYDMTDLRMLPGAGGSLTLDSTEGGRQWKLRAGAHAVCDGASVMDCDAGGGCAIVVTAYDNRGNNANWRIAAFNEWTGANGTAWDDGDNWSGGVPTETSDVRIPSTDNAPTLSSATAVRSLTVGDGDGTVTLNLSAPLAITDFLLVNGGATVVADQPIAVTNDVHVAAGGTITHSKGTTYKLNMTVGGNVTIEEDGAIEANGKGDLTKGNTWGWGYSANYGGKRSEGGYIGTARCYGSIREPSDLGSKGNASSGGGAIRLVVSGTLRVDGALSAESFGPDGGYGAGSGGSVWVDAGNVAGAGRVSVISHGKDDGTGYIGGGGRIAVKLTDATDFSAADSVDFRYGTGTFYRETLNDAPGRGELIMNGAGTREFSNTVTDSEEPFGKITLIGTSGTRKISILDGVIVSTCGDFGTAGWTVEAEAGTAGGVNVLGPQDGTVRLAGTMTLGAFVCTNGTKAVEFAKGMTVSVADNGILWLEGTDRVKTVLRSSEIGSSWNLAAGTNLTGKVRNLDVSDSVASDQPIKARRSIGRKARNLNWEFPAGMYLMLR